jgi:hypothetical protein
VARGLNWRRGETVFGLKIGDLVREGANDPVMRIVGFVESGWKAVCQVVGSLVRKVVPIALLVLAAGGPIAEVAHGKCVDDNPAHLVVQRELQTPTIPVSGAIAAAVPPRPMAVQPPDAFMPLAQYGSGSIMSGAR